MDPESIARKKITCFFVSPHIDDAIFSAGGLISYLAEKTKVVIVNVFSSQGEPPYTLSAKKFLKQSGYGDMKTLFDNRIKEESRLADKLGIKVVNLGYTDASFRKRNKSFWTELLGRMLSETVHLYPVYRINVVSGKISRLDRDLMERIARDLKDLVKKEKKYQVFSPLGVGKHVDHLIVRRVVERQFKSAYFWSDFPYNLKTGSPALDSLKPLNTFKSRSGLRKKEELMRFYKSQVWAVFPSRIIPRKPEMFYQMR